jgi:hypothetical protein
MKLKNSGQTWSNEVQFNNPAEWIPNLENEIPDSNTVVPR